jgi:subtilisin-like proprotein convertase family protein
MQRIAMILVIVAGAWGSAICAGSVHIYSGNFGLLIPANPDDTNGWMADAVIEVPHHFIIHDLDVGISLTHENFIDLQIILQSPWGTAIVLNPALNIALLNIGGHMEIVFDDEAEVLIECAVAPLQGSYRPVDPLAVFHGENVFGEWRLKILDWWPPDTGTLDSFELIIATPEPATAVLLALGFSLMTLLNHPGKQ